VHVTARDRTYVPQLLHSFGIRHTVIGHGRPESTIAKARALAARTALLMRYAAGKKFDVAVGHGSRALAPAARLSGVKNLTMFDYEHVSTWIFRTFCDRILIPRATMGRPSASVATGSAGKRRSFPGATLPCHPAST